jgi:hypothetical protein
MKKLICLLLLLGCKPEPELYIDGKPYYTETYCVSSHRETEWKYHYGYYMGKYQNHYGPYTTTICDSYKTDTLEIK